MASRAVLAAAFLALSLGGAAVSAAAQYSPAGASRLVAIYPPWWPAAQALAAASEAGPVAGVGAASVFVGLSAAGPGAVAALKRGGALLVLDGRAFSSCFPSSKVSR